MYLASALYLSCFLLVVCDEPPEKRIFEEMTPSRFRTYGRIPENSPPISISDFNEVSCPFDRLCGRVIVLRNNQILPVAVHRSFCSFYVQAGDDCTLTIPQQDLELQSCRDEYLFIGQVEGKRTTLCDISSLEVQASRQIFVQYENNKHTGSDVYFEIRCEAKTDSISQRSVEQPTQLCPSECGAAASTMRTSRVLGGIPVAPYAHPWMAQLILTFRSPDGETDIKTCGGAILDKLNVITAHHCFIHGDSTMRIHRVQVVVGTNKAYARIGDSSAILRNSVSFFTPRVPSGKFERLVDIVIVRLASELPFNSKIAPACLPEMDSFVGHDATFIGVGSTTGEESSNILSEGTFMVKNSSICNEYFTEKLGMNHTLYAHEMCVYSAVYDSCSGDSGGPILIQQEGKYQQIGVISYGLPCNASHAEHYGVATKVRSARSFIFRVITNATC